MAKITEPAEMQTPNTPNTELQQNVQANNNILQPELGSTVSAPSFSKVEQVPQLGEVAKNERPQATNNVQQINNSNNVSQNVEQQPQTNLVSNQDMSPSVAVKIPSDFNDTTVQGYLEEYRAGVERNDYQAQINALNAIDKYRTENGYNAIYTQNVYELVNQRKNKIENAIRDYETDIQSAIDLGDTELAGQIGQQLEAYKRSVNYSDTVDNASNYLKNVEYKSTYDSIISGIVNELLTAKFSYDPSDDEALLKAQAHATNTVYESMNAKGLLYSTMTAQIITKTVNDLIPVYEKMAKEEFYNNIERMQTMANFIMNIEDNQYNRWLNNVQMRLQYYEAQRDEIEYQWDRVNQLGYVDNEASIILGVAPGTMSPAMRQSILEAKQSAEEQYNKLYSDIALAEAKARIEQAQQLNVYEGKKRIDSQYSNNSSSSKISRSDLSTILKQQLKITTEDGEKIVEDGEISVADAISAIFNSGLDYDDIDVTLANTLDMTRKEAIDKYTTYVIDALEKQNGQKLTDENKQDFSDAIVSSYAKGDIQNEELALALVDALDARVESNKENEKKNKEYEEVYKHYEQLLNNQIDYVNKNSKKDLENIVGPGKDIERVSEYMEDYRKEIADKYGTDKLRKLEDMISQKEERIEEILNSKGIDW